MRIKDNLAFFENLSRENSKSELGAGNVKSSLTGPKRGSRGPLKSNPLPPLKKALSTELSVSDKNVDLKRFGKKNGFLKEIMISFYLIRLHMLPHFCRSDDGDRELL